jgi:putative transcriptional regulator
MEGMEPAPGSLLIASATLVDPNFARCLLLVLDSNDDGTLAVILNRPSDAHVGEVLGSWRDLVTQPDVLFRGGPVEGNAALALGRLSGPVVPPGWQPLVGPVGVLDLDSDPMQYVGHLAALRLYAGYAGWGAGQLDQEIAEGSWHLAAAEEADLFTATPERLWSQVLRRQPVPVSLLTTLPHDANLN